MSDAVLNTPLGDILRRQTAAIKAKREAHFRDVEFEKLKKTMTEKSMKGKNELVEFTERSPDFITWIKNEHKIQYGYDPKRHAYVFRW